MTIWLAGWKSKYLSTGKPFHNSVTQHRRGYITEVSVHLFLTGKWSIEMIQSKVSHCDNWKSYFINQSSTQIRSLTVAPLPLQATQPAALNCLSDVSMRRCRLQNVKFLSGLVGRGAVRRKIALRPGSWDMVPILMSMTTYFWSRNISKYG